MKKYIVNVNGKRYEVELESVETKEGSVASKPTEPKIETKSEGHTVVAPMQGTIIKSNVQVGSQVHKGTKLFILEAMKLENEILAPHDGVVKAVLVNQGQAVDLHQPLIVIG